MAAGGGGGDAPTFEVGQQILIQGRHIGTVKFFGKTAFDPAGRMWVGVELEKPYGKHDGKVKDTRYFTAKAKHGTFVPPAQCTLYTEEMAAAQRIQSAARGAMARRKVTQELSWRTYNALDADDEATHLQRRSRLIAAGLTPASPEKLTSRELEMFWDEVDSMEVDPTYDGPEIRFPVTGDNCLELMMFFKRGGMLPVKQTVQIISRFTAVISKVPTLQETTVNEGEHLTVVGDTHGQLQDLFSIFTINGIPDETNRYIFNGDFVDRGSNGSEIVLTLMMLHLAYPKSVLMDRGNHEERSQNETQGFMREVRGKYGAHWQKVYDSFHAAFDNLPLATLIEKAGRRVFVVHGGLFDRNHNVRLAHIAAIKRKREIPWGRRTFEDRLFEDMMWSDPREDMRGTEKSSRGAGVFFGPDVTERFCALNGISLVIRSHECVKEGFLYQHGDRCLTIFSASRYTGTGTNNGAFIVFDAELTNVVQQFVAGPLETTAPARLPPGATSRPYMPAPAPSAAEHDDADQLRVVREKIIERVVLHKPDLYWYFANADKTRTGTVTRLEWAEGMGTVLAMPDVPWVRLSHSLADADAEGNINYAKFLDRYRIKMRDEDTEWQERVLEKVCERLYKLTSGGTLEDAYELFDVNRDGKIEYHEFVTSLERLEVGLSKDQIYELMRTIDTDSDSHLDFGEFAKRFRVVFTRVSNRAKGIPVPEDDIDPKAARAAGAAGAAGGGGGGGSGTGAGKAVAAGAPGAAPLEEGEGKALDEWTAAALERVGKKLFADGRNAAQVFQRIDTDSDGAVSFSEFQAALAELDLEPAFTEREAEHLMRAIDTNRSNHINYLEFLNAFKVVDAGSEMGKSWQKSVIERVVSVLYEYRIELNAAFEKFDLDNSGTVSAEEFRLGLRALTGALGSPLTDMQSDELLRALDKNGDGQLSYAEFLDGFRIVDVKEEETEFTKKGGKSEGE